MYADSDVLAATDFSTFHQFFLLRVDFQNPLNTGILKATISLSVDTKRFNDHFL